MSRSYPTLEQRRKNKLYFPSTDGRDSSDVDQKSRGKSPYESAARKLWRLSDDWEVNLMMKVFGPALIGRVAAALDPAKNFRTGHHLIADANRTRTGKVSKFSTGFNRLGTFKHYANYVSDSSPPVTEFLVEEGTDDDDTSSSFVGHTEMIDSTRSSRPKGVPFSTMESRTTSSTWKHNPANFSTSSDIKYYINDDRTLYDRYVYTWSYQFEADNPIFYPSDNWSDDVGIATFREVAKQLAADRLVDILPKCLTNRRLFNSFYQFAELKDVPQMIEGILRLHSYIGQLAKDPKTKFLTLDKVASDSYLNWLFGVQSLEQAIKQALKLPTKVAKRFNYLLQRNSKVTTQRFTQVLKDEDLYDSWDLWAWYYSSYWSPSLQNVRIKDNDLSNEFIEQRFSGELRCVVNSTLNFPNTAVPLFSDSAYLDLVGLQPRVIDIYNLIPFTWLVDWFIDISGYLNLVESTAGDKDLVNYGFMTFLYKSELTCKAKYEYAESYTAEVDLNGDMISESFGPWHDLPELDVRHHMEYRSRYRIDDLLGVKSVDNRQGLLTDQQKSILGALLTKFT